MKAAKKPNTLSAYIGSQPDSISSNNVKGVASAMKNRVFNEELLIKIVVKRTGASECHPLYLSLTPNSTVHDLKTMIQEELSIGADSSEDLPVERQRLVFAGRMLTRDLDVLSCLKMKIGEVNFVHLVPLPKPPNKSITRRTPKRNQRMHHPYQSFHVAEQEQGSTYRTTNRERTPQNFVASSQRSLDSQMMIPRRQGLYQEIHPVSQDSQFMPSVLHQLTPLQNIILPHQQPSLAPMNVIHPDGAYYLVELQQAVLHDVNALVPNGHSMPNILNLVAHDIMALTETESSIYIQYFEELAHRSMILSLSLRSMLQGQQIWGHTNADTMFGCGTHDTPS